MIEVNYMGHRKLSDTVKHEAVQLVVTQGYSVPKAAQAMGVGPTALRRWVAQWRAEQPGAAADEPQRIRELEAQLAEMKRVLAETQEERDTLKKSTAFFVREMLRAGK